VVAPRYCFTRLMKERGAFESRCIISFDCDFPRDVEALRPLVRLLGEFAARASFACIGQWVCAYSDEHRRLVDAGHEIVNHTQTHPNLYHADYDYAREEGLSHEYFNRIGLAGRRREIERGHAQISEVLGVEPTGFRTPHFGALHVDDIYGILAEIGYRFSSSTMVSRAGPMPYRTGEGIWEIPVSPCPQHPFGVFDSWHSIGKSKASHSSQGELTALFADLLDAVFVGKEGGLVNIYLDPYDAVESGELRTMLELLQERSISTTDYSDLCDELERVPDAVASEVEALQEFVE
jgi:peptidoglycan-N-acetylglucosamine deacetylase